MRTNPTGSDRRLRRRTRPCPVQVTFVSVLLLVWGIYLVSLALPLAGKGARAWFDLEGRIGRHAAYGRLWDSTLAVFDFGRMVDDRKPVGMAVLLVLSAVMLTAAVALFLRRRFGRRMAVAVIGIAVACEGFASVHDFLYRDVADFCAHLAQTLLLLCALLLISDPRVSAWLEEKRVDAKTFA